MIGLPHRVGAAYVVLGQANGTQPRVGHVLNDAVYGDASPAQYHTYYGNYPVTTPDNVITKVQGTLGVDYTYTSATNNNIPGNFIYIASYKTELNHYLPTAATEADTNLPSYDSTSLLRDYDPPFEPGNSGKYLADLDVDIRREMELVKTTEAVASLLSSVKSSFTHITDVTDVLDDPTVNFTSSKFYPRWAAESEYAQYGMLNTPIEITIGEEPTFYQTREGPANTPPAEQVGVYWIQPWGVGRINDGLGQRLNIDCNVSYKFTKDATVTSTSYLTTAYNITYPWVRFAPDPLDPDHVNREIPDVASWQYSYGVTGYYADAAPAGSNRTVGCQFFPILSGEDYAYVNYENKSTHGLFLSADGSCWNIGTEITVKVYIWKAPPKSCLFYKSTTDTPLPLGNGWWWYNWKFDASGTPTYERHYQSWPTICVNPGGPGTGTFTEGNFRFEGGVDSDVPYSIAEPKPVNLHYWGCVFAMDTESELCVEHEVREFTITVEEGNTYTCNGDPKEGVSMSQFGFKVADIELPPIEGYITFIKDFEVTSVKRPPSA